jgi:hypothetical protein
MLKAFPDSVNETGVIAGGGMVRHDAPGVSGPRAVDRGSAKAANCSNVITTRNESWLSPTSV